MKKLLDFTLIAFTLATVLIYSCAEDDPTPKDGDTTDTTDMNDTTDVTDPMDTTDMTDPQDTTDMTDPKDSVDNTDTTDVVIGDGWTKLSAGVGSQLFVHGSKVIVSGIVDGKTYVKVSSDGGKNYISKEVVDGIATLTNMGISKNGILTAAMTDFNNILFPQILIGDVTEANPSFKFLTRADYDPDSSLVALSASQYLALEDGTIRFGNIYSEDDGVTWHASKILGLQPNLQFSNGNLGLAAGFGNLHASTDGETLPKINEATGWSGQVSRVMTSNGKILVITNDAVNISTDDGVSWTNITEGIPQALNGGIIAPDGDIYVFEFGLASEVFELKDGETTFTQIDTEAAFDSAHPIIGAQIMTMAYLDGNILVATNYNDVYAYKVD